MITDYIYNYFFFNENNYYYRLSLFRKINPHVYMYLIEVNNCVMSTEIEVNKCFVMTFQLSLKFSTFIFLTEGMFNLRTLSQVLATVIKIF